MEEKGPHLRETTVTISTRTFIRFGFFVLVLISLIEAVRKARHAILILFAAFLLALCLNGPVYSLSKILPGKRKGSRIIATALSFLIIVVLIGAFLASILPPLIHQTKDFLSALPRLIKDLKSQNSEVGKLIRKYHLQKNLTSISTQIKAHTGNIGGTAFHAAKTVGTSIVNLLTILVLTFMMLVEGPNWISFSRDVVPDKHHQLFDRITKDMYKVIRGYVNGQVTLAIIASILIMPAVLILHISYPAAILVIIFVCGLIPMVGHTIGAVIVTLIALFDSATAAIIILAYYISYQQIENIFIQPKIQANSTNMSPLLVFSSLTLGISFGGLFGGLVAIPVAGCIRIAILEFLRIHKIIDTPQFKQVTTLKKDNHLIDKL